MEKNQKKKKGQLYYIYKTKKIKFWKRYFNDKLFQTYSNIDDKIFIEKQGVISFEFVLKGDKCKIEYLFKKMKIAGIKFQKF